MRELRYAVHTHTFLFHEGLWNADGHYSDDKGNTFPAAGESRVVHEPARWRIDGALRVAAPEPFELGHRYEVMPFAPNRSTTVWSSVNPALGGLSGEFSVVQEFILSHFRSGDGRHSGCEILLQLNPKTYRSEGSLFQGRQRLSSWAVLLRLAE